MTTPTNSRQRGPGKVAPISESRIVKAMTTPKPRQRKVSKVRARKHNCLNGLHRKPILSPNRALQRWEIRCSACNVVVEWIEWWSFESARPAPSSLTKKEV